MKKNKALILGCAGQDGSYLAELLLDKGYEVHGFIRRTSNPNTRNIRSLLYNPEIFNKTFFLHDGDLSDSGSLYNVINKVRPTEIYNFACMAGVSPSFYQPEYTIDTGGLAVLRILEAIRYVDPTIKFFQAGSSHIFGNTPESPQTEQTPKQPISPYGLGKALGQQVINYYRQVHGIYACSAIFYAHASPRYSESFLLGKVVHSIWRILKGEQQFFEVGNLDVPTDVGYAKDYVEAAWQMMQLDKPDDFIICTGELHTPREFIDIAFAEAGLSKDKLKVNESLKRPSEVSILVGDFTKAKEAFGYSPKTSFETLVKTMVNEVPRL